RTGYLQGATTTISETAGSGNALCGPIGTKVTLANGATVDAALPSSPTLQGGANTYTVTNSVQCAAQVTLVKVVDNGPAVPGAWTLSATRGDAGNLQGPSGASGTPAATGTVTAGGTYSLGETGGDNRYVQKGDWSCTDGVTV